jgi:recombination protein RecT
MKEEAMTTKELSLVETKLKSAQERLVAVSPVSRAQAERAMQVLLTLTRKELKECSVSSVLMAALNVAKLGLMPDPQLGHVYIVPFRDNKSQITEATIIVGYRGLIELGRRGGMKTIRAECVYANDLFEYEAGLHVHLRHIPWWMRGQDGPGEMRAAYTLASTTADTIEYITVLPVSELDKARKASKAGDSAYGPWSRYTDQMRLKTCVRRASKFWPLSAELSAAVDLDEREERGDPQEIYDLGEIEDETEALPGGRRIMAGAKKDKPAPPDPPMPEPDEAQ